MKNILALIIAAFAITGCTVEFGFGSGSGHYVSEGHYADASGVRCDPVDYDYMYTVFDCYDAYYEVELCDPDAVYIRPGCWESWDREIIELSTSGCYHYHVCEQW